MGCWNETCFISNLPIRHGDEVYLFVLAPISAVNQEGPLCNPDDRYIPVGFPIAGEYDDYGGIKNIQYNLHLKEYFENFPMYTKKCSDNPTDQY